MVRQRYEDCSHIYTPRGPMPRRIDSVGCICLAGSGAIQPISSAMIKALSKINSPLIIGGGLKTIKGIQEAHESGANLVVIGNKLEEDIDFLLDLKNYMTS